MSYLLDTHVLLWWFQKPGSLLQKAQSAIQQRSQGVYVSSVSTWEILIKRSLGKIRVPNRLFSFIKSQGFLELPITIEHTLGLTELPLYHQDPFDRLLVAQAQAENLILITADTHIMEYDVRIIKAK